MNKKLLTTLAAAMGTMLFAGMASAQTFSGVATSTKTSGSYDVTLLETSPTTFQVVSVTGNAGSAAGNTNPASVSQIKVQFFSSLNAAPPTDDVVSLSGHGGTQTSGPYGQQFGTNATFNDPGFGTATADPLPGDGSQTFSQTMYGYNGVITVMSAPAKSVKFTLVDANNNMFSFQDVINTPEAASVWLMLAALLPVVILGLRRRRSMQQ